MTLLRPSQLSAIQRIAKRGMQTPLVIRRPTYDEDDKLDPGAIVFSGKGWLHTTPEAEATQDGGIVTVNTHRLNLPVGTDVLPRDRITINSREYVVVDTTADETWPAMLTCSLRLRE